MSDFYYSDRNDPPIPQEQETITPEAWGALVSLVDQALDNGSLARAFPLRDCHNHDKAGDGPITGVDHPKLFRAMCGEIPRLPLVPDSRKAYRLDAAQVPDTSSALDMVEFIGPHIHSPDGENRNCTWDGVDVHYRFAEFTPQDSDDLFCDEQPRLAPGQEEYCQTVERIFRRQGLAFTLDRQMKVSRRGPYEARAQLSNFHPQTGDQALDKLFTLATTRFLSPDLQERIWALEKLWDAYEWTMTLHPEGKDKKDSASKLLRQAAGGSEKLFQLLDTEFLALNKIGNNFRIRHFGRFKSHELPSSEFVDYLFTRMLAALAFVLRSCGRMTACVQFTGPGGSARAPGAGPPPTPPRGLPQPPCRSAPTGAGHRRRGRRPAWRPRNGWERNRSRPRP